MLSRKLVAIVSSFALMLGMPSGSARATSGATVDVLISTTSPEGVHRDGGRIYRGDIVSLLMTWAEPAVNPVPCSVFEVSHPWGSLMRSPGTNQPDGSCEFKFVVPSLNLPWEGAYDFLKDQGCSFSLKIWIYLPVNSYSGDAPNDCQLQPSFTYEYADQNPAETACTDCEPLLSWNPSDYQESFQELQFQETWNWQAPEWVEDCGLGINGAWRTAIVPSSGCSVSMRLPGVLPSNMPWGSVDGYLWGYDMLVAYRDKETSTSRFTMGAFSTPMKPSDEIFTSSLPAIFPTNLSAVRFTPLGDTWEAKFHVSYGGAEVEAPTGTYCELTVLRIFGGFTGWTPDSDNRFHTETVQMDANGDCVFAVATPFTEALQSNMWTVRAWYPNGSASAFSATITAIPQPTVPIIGDPTENLNGSTQLAVESGLGQGLLVSFAVTPWVESGYAVSSSQGSTPYGVAAFSPATTVCSGASFSANISNGVGGAVPDAVANCVLEDGDYLVTAFTVDASGKRVTATRIVTVGVPEAPGVLRNPTLTGVARVGGALEAASGEWAGSPAPHFTYQWYRCSSSGGTRMTLPVGCTLINGAIGGTVNLVGSDYQKYLRVAITATNKIRSVTAFSATSSKILGAKSNNVVRPSIAGSTSVGSTLTASRGTWTGYPAPTYAYQWYACTTAVSTARSTVPGTCTKITSATRSTFKLTSVQRGKYVAVFVTGTSLGTTATTWLSKTTAKVR